MIAAFTKKKPVRKPGLTRRDVEDIAIVLTVTVTYLACFYAAWKYEPPPERVSSVILIERYAFIPVTAIEEVTHAA